MNSFKSTLAPHGNKSNRLDKVATTRVAQFKTAPFLKVTGQIGEPQVRGRTRKANFKVVLMSTTNICRFSKNKITVEFTWFPC